MLRLRSRRSNRRGERGQALVIFTISLVAMVSVAGLLVDGGMAWATRRQAQAAADTAAMAAAKTYGATSDLTEARTAASAVSAANGYNATFTDCQNQSNANGVVVSSPPATGAFAGQSGYVEVTVTRAMRTGFASIVGQPCWLVSARAVAVVTSQEVATCNFCSLNNSSSNHTLLLKNGAQLRVDGDIHANSSNGGKSGSCTAKGWKVCGDGFDIFGDGGKISAKHITVVGGWETHDGNTAVADELAPGCVLSVDPPSQPTKPSNVCIHMPEIADPFNDPSKPGAKVTPPSAGAVAVPGQNGCPATAVIPSGSISSASLTKISSGNRMICPGTYYGGLQISGGSVTMEPGVYIMVGGGFQIINSGEVDGRSGVMIYATGSAGGGHSTSQGTSLVPDPVAGFKNINDVELDATSTTVDPGDSVTFTLELDPGGKEAAPSGYVDFYDGNVMLCGATPVVQPNVKNALVTATCSTTYATWGTRAISAVYSGDAVYNPAGDAVSITVRAPSGIKDGPITIETSGRVDLHGMASGPYAGMTIFQDRASSSTITIAPGKSSAGGCQGWFMTRGVPPDTGDPPDPCGDLGGLQGTIYAAHQNALVLIEASGMANLQVIAGEIQVNSDDNARFGFKASVFAGSSIHLVE